MQGGAATNTRRGGNRQRVGANSHRWGPSGLLSIEAICDNLLETDGERNGDDPQGEEFMAQPSGADRVLHIVDVMGEAKLVLAEDASSARWAGHVRGWWHRSKDSR